MLLSMVDVVGMRLFTWGSIMMMVMRMQWVLVAAMGLALASCGGSGGGSAAGQTEPESTTKLAKDFRGDGLALEIPGLLAYLPFDGDLQDRSPLGNHGAATGAPAIDRFGLAEGAWALDGEADFVALSAHALPRQPTEFTIALWVQTRATDLATFIFAGEINGGGMWLRYSPVKKELTALSQGVFKVEAAADLSDGGWHHLAMRFDGEALDIFVDGVMEQSGPVTDTLTLGDAPMAFGRLGEPTGGFARDHLPGAIDDVAVFGRKLSPAEVASLFDEGPARPPVANAGDDQLVYFGAAKLDGTNSSDPDGEVVEYIWDFGGGITKKGKTVEHAFEEPGIYEVELTVVDDEGNSSTDTVLIEVVVMEDDWSAEWAQKEIDMIHEVNVARSKGANCGGDIFGPAGPVELDPVIRIAARLHSLDMGQQGYFEHEGLDGRSPFDRMADVGFNGPQPWAENIAAGSQTAAEANEGLMNSPGHCRNIMNPSFNVLGVGHAFVPGSPLRYYWTQNFAAGHGDPPK